MKVQFLIAAAAALTLSACGKPAADEPATKQDIAAVPAKAEAAKSAAAGIAFSREFMIGKWAEEKDGDCTLAQDFKADGSVDGVFDSWSVEGSNVIAKVAGETLKIPVKVIDQTHVETIRNDGTANILVRC